MDLKTNSANRFSDRVQNYVRYRPGYPSESLSFILENAAVKAGEKVIDLGAGTGILSQLMLDRGLHVTGVEPNDAMRKASVHALGSVCGFRSVAGWSHDTGLDGNCAELITAAQAFHWFDLAKTRQECERLLKPGRAMAVLFNERLIDVSPFLGGYEALLQRFATDYNAINHTNITDATYRAFFGNDQFLKSAFRNVQEFDYSGIEGRLLSSSYAPAPGHPDHESMIKALRGLFDQTQTNGTVTIEYQTWVYLGRFFSV